MNKITISTQNLIIRNLKPEDLNDFFLYRSNPEVTKYQGFDVMTVASAETFINSQKERSFGIPGEWLQLGIQNKQTGRLIGDCAIKLDAYDPRIAEVGITISHLEQKKGFAKESFTGILSFLFESAQIHRVVETVDTENNASINLLKSMGFRQEGHFIENIFFKGKWGSEFQYAMLQSEWNNLKNKKS